MNALIQKMTIFLFENRMVTYFFISFITGLGIYSFASLNIDAYPDISGVQVQVITEFRGRATEEVEEQVTIPLEKAFLGISNLENIRSKSIFGLSVIQLLFNSKTDDDWARQQVAQRLNTAVLPDNVNPSMGSLSTAYGEIYRYELLKSAESKIDDIELREIHDWVVRPSLLRAKGVVEIVNFGGKSKQYAIHVEPKKLIQYGARLQDIVQAVQENNNNGGGSIIQRGSSSIVIRGIGRYFNYKELENVFIKNSYGTDVFVKDIGQVVIDTKAVSGIFGKDNDSDAIEGIVKMKRGENPSDVLTEIHKVVDKLNKELEVSGIQIKPFYDRETLIHQTLETVFKNACLGIIFVTFVLFAFLGELKVSFIVSLTIPFSLIFALVLMYLFGIPISLLSIGSIDFGILVDGSVIIIESIFRELRNENYSDKKNKILKSVFQVQKPMIFSMGIVIIAYIPLLSLQKIEGLLFRPMAITICFALLGAAIFATFIVPILSDQFLKGSKEGEIKRKTLSDRLYESYSNSLSVVLKNGKIFLISIAVFFVSSVCLLYPKMGLEFLPYMDEGVFWLRANFPEGISLSETTEFAQEIRDFVRTYEEVSFVTSQTGRNDDGTDPFPLNRIEFMIGLKKTSEWKNFHYKAEIERDLRTRLFQKFPTIRINLTQPIIDSVTEDTNGTSADLAVDISGRNLHQLRKIGELIRRELEGIPGSVNVAIEQEAQQPQMKIKIDKNRLALYRISARAINNVINTAIGGIPVSEIYEGERKFEILVKYAPEYRESISTISLLPVFNEQGEAIPLGQLCQITIDDGETIIYRAGGYRRITVRTDIRDRAQNDFVKEAQQRILPLFNKSEWTGIEIQWLGMFENLTRAKFHFFFLIPATLAFIGFFMFLYFQSAIDAILILMVLPFATIGSLYALAFRGFHLSVSAGVGFTTLLGIAAMHSILMISSFKKNEKEKVFDPVFEGAKTRFRPVLMTASVAFIGLLPASLSHEIGSDIQRPIATVMIWGIAMSAIVTLYILPTMYHMFVYRSKFDQR